MKGLVWIVMGATVASALSGCGVVYRQEVVTSGCISSARTYSEEMKIAKVDGFTTGPGTVEIRFIPPEDEPGKSERPTVVGCDVAHDGELGEMRVGGKEVEGDRFEAAKKAFSDIARSPAWANR